jgi:nitrite reductase/ring-hydroxylating ferredoxin subunit
MEKRLWPVCHRSDVADPGCREFELRDGDIVINGFVLHWKGKWYAYRNSCPHTGVALNWLPNQFFDLGQEFLQCGLHGALFQPEDGLCIYGPCVGRSLRRLPVVQCADEIAIDCAGLVNA